MTSLTTEQVMELQQGKDSLAIHAYIWPLVISVSVVLLLSRRLRWSKAANVDGGEPEANLQTRIPVGYDIVQQFTRAALFSLAVLGYVKDDSSTLQELVALGYALLLDAVRICRVKTLRERSKLSFHVNCIVFVHTCLVFIQISPSILLIHARSAPSLWLSSRIGVSFFSLFLVFITPRDWIPPPMSFGLAHRKKPMPSPEQTCSYFSYFVSYGWLTNVIFTGAKRRLVSSDMLPLPEYDEPLIWRERMLDARRLYNTTLKSLGYALRYNIGAMIFWATVTAVVEFLAPFGLYFLLNYIQNPSEATVRPWPWVLLLFLGPWGRSIAYQQYIFSSTRLVVRTRLCLVQEIYAKAARCFDSDSVQPDGEEESKAEETTRRGVKSRDNSGNSQAQSITNLMAYDVDSISNSRDFILVCTASPIEVTLGLVFLYRLFGPCSLITLLVMVLSFPLATILSRIMSGFQLRVMKKTDQRVSLISEYLSSIRTIKYLGWEDVLGKKVNEARREEESLTWRRNLTAVAVAVLGDFVPLFAMFALFTVYTLVLGNPLTASKAFTALSIIETLRLQFVWMANVTRFYTQARVAFARIDKFLIGEQEVARHPIGPPAFHNATFRRALPQDSFRLRLDGSFASGGLNIITGASGCGKSSLLLSLLGETVLEDGSATCPRDVAYSSQIPWLIDDTIRANILLHEEFNSDRYKRVIEACCLLHDLDMLENGDLTRVGANGSTLSGGQKQRISLARAIYSRSELLLLDDIFSALDAVTQKHVWEYCFQKDLLQGRTVILVTRMQAAKDAADLVMELSQGEIVSTTRRDTPNGRVKSPALLPQIPRMRKRTAEAVVKSIESTCPLRSDSIEAKVDQEIAGQGRNSRLLFFQYMVMFGGPGKAMLAITLCLFSQLAFFAIPLWLSVLVGASSGKDATNVGFYVAIYGAWLLAFSVIFAMSHAYLQWGARQAAHALHKKLVMAAMWVSVHCYEKNPPGRFINRFSSDMYSLDSILVEYLRVAIDNIFRFVLRLTAIGSIMPIFALPAAFICFIGFVCAELYTRTQLSVKALVSASQSPVFSFFVEGVAGRAVIRSRHGLQDAFADTLAKRMRVYARAAETQFNLNRWICVRADGCAAVIALATGIIAVSLESHAPAGRLGFSLTSAISLGQTILTMVRSMNELEAELNCFYRVREYASLPLEESDDPQDPPASIDLPASWPSNGKIEFRGVTAKYTRDGPAILCGLSLTISPGERVAIVGRTGSGKSTLALSLLGFTEIVEGTILVDDIDISTIPRRVLRRRLTIIPQEPVLFSSDVRSNIDPTLSVGDACLNKAIKACSIVKSLAAPRNGQLSQTATQESPLSTDDEREPRFTGLSLDAKVAPRGSNFSVGERQVLSLARATVRRSRVVVLDEATASLDHGSDAAFQQVLRSAFQGRTLLAIVHRLSTILDYDRVVVMGAGSILETGPPIELYKTGGTFASMVNQSIEHGKRGEWTQEKLKLLE